jgi:putative polyhydroxyalkanoate system protein
MKMATIHFTQPHSLSLEAARAAATAMAERMALDYGVVHEWEGNTLRFHQVGLDGSLELANGEARLAMELHGLMAAFAPTVEEKLERKMRELFTA